MHGTRTTVTLLAGVAMAALSGCVAVDSPPAAPSTAPSRTTAPEGQDVAPQIVPGPAREALEAALPDPPEPGPRADTARRPAGPAAAPVSRPRRAERLDPSPVPEEHRPSARPPAVPLGVPRVPRDRSEVCALGQAYGGWAPDSPQAKLCRGTYGP
ncbi:hypothetical protein [Streptomyces sp. NPDC090025]|uniref:hypothetical protein n=1 Tax=Streptomyces sp. NPDC090025 TaxID=3365922 RepID=UPI00383485AB